jgi:hypothetical protein
MHHHHESVDGIGQQPARPSETSLVTEFLPYLAEILNPPMRTVSTSLPYLMDLSKEKQILIKHDMECYPGEPACDEQGRS